MANDPFQNVYAEDRTNFQQFNNSPQWASANKDAQSFVPELSALYPSQDQFDRAVVTRMLQQGGAYQYLNPRYINFLQSEAPKMGALQDMEAIATGGTGNTNNTSLPRAQDFPEFFKNFISPNGWGSYGYGMLPANGMATLWNQFISKYNNVVTKNQFTDPNIWGYLTGLSNSDLYNLNRFAIQGVYGSPSGAALDNYLKSAYEGFDQSSLGWTQFLNQIMGNQGHIGLGNPGKIG